ncbi:MAG: phytanoyl-CoA dioxygenase family protein [Pseudomonadota bacterium]
MGTIDLDLSFQATPPAAGKRLSAGQIDHYNREGFLGGLDVFDANQVQRNLAYFDDLLSQRGGEGTYAINCYQARCAGIWDRCTNETILDHVEDIIGPDIVCWASHFFCKMPGDPKVVPWHQDASFWKLSPARTVTVWLAIDDADDENAAMRFIPRTHDKGYLEWRTPEGDAALNQELVGVEAMGKPVTNTLRAGQISLHADMLAHGSLANMSERRRCGLTIRYCPPEVRITDETWKKGVEAIICRGTDRSRHWQHHQRPAGDDVSPENSPRNVGGN